MTRVRIEPPHPGQSGGNIRHCGTEQEQLQPVQLPPALLQQMRQALPLPGMKLAARTPGSVKMNEVGADENGLGTREPGRRSAFSQWPAHRHMPQAQQRFQRIRQAFIYPAQRPERSGTAPPPTESDVQIHAGGAHCLGQYPIGAHQRQRRDAPLRQHLLQREHAQAIVDARRFERALLRNGGHPPETEPVPRIQVIDQPPVGYPALTEFMHERQVFASDARRMSFQVTRHRRNPIAGGIALPAQHLVRTCRRTGRLVPHDHRGSHGISIASLISAGRSSRGRSTAPSAPCLRIENAQKHRRSYGVIADGDGAPQ
jgi:hypothetical protein